MQAQKNRGNKTTAGTQISQIGGEWGELSTLDSKLSTLNSPYFLLNSSTSGYSLGSPLALFFSS